MFEAVPLTLDPSDDLVNVIDMLLASTAPENCQPIGTMTPCPVGGASWVVNDQL